MDLKEAIEIFTELFNSLKDHTKCPKCGYHQYCPCSSCKDRLPEGIKPYEWIDGELMKCSNCGYTLHCDGWLDIEYNEYKLQQALSLAISKLQLLEQVEEGGMEKTCHIILNKEKRFQCEVCSMKHNCSCISYNLAIDLCQAELAKKLEGIEKILEEKIGIEKEKDLIKYNIWKESIKDLAQAIITYLTKND